MKVFLDANVIIDVVLNRTDFIDISSKVLQLGLDGQCELCTSDITFTTVSLVKADLRHQICIANQEIIDKYLTFVEAIEL